MKPAEKFIAEVRAAFADKTAANDLQGDAERLSCIGASLDAYDDAMKAAGTECPNRGYCFEHQTGNPHSMTGEKYVE